MDKYITQRKPYIQERVDEDDSMLYIFTQNVVLCNILLIAMTKYKTYDNWIQMDYKRRFGHHPEDWEIDEPSLLERHMPTLTIQRKAEREAAIRSREKLLQIDERYRSKKLVDGIEEEIIGTIKHRVKDSFIRKRMRHLEKHNLRGTTASNDGDDEKKSSVEGKKWEVGEHREGK